MSVRKVTIGDIAHASKASPATVSLVLRDKPGIGAETRERVLAVAQELGYRRREVRPIGEERRQKTMALLFRTRTRSTGEEAPGVNPFYSWVLTGLEAAARARQMNLLYATLPVDERNEVIDVPTHILDQPLDGALIVGPFSDRTLADLLGARSFPAVLVDGPSYPRNVDVVASDNAGGARVAVRHLIDQGHQRIGLITSQQSSDPNFLQRAEGYLCAMREAGLAPLHGPMSGHGVAVTVKRMLEEHPDVTGFFCVNDRFAMDAMKVAIGEGRRIPETLSVIGFDDIDSARQLTPSLTTMAVDKVGMGRRAIDVLDFRIQWPDAAPTVTTLLPNLVLRESSGRPPHAG